MKHNQMKPYNVIKTVEYSPTNRTTRDCIVNSISAREAIQSAAELFDSQPGETPKNTFYDAIKI